MDDSRQFLQAIVKEEENVKVLISATKTMTVRELGEKACRALEIEDLEGKKWLVEIGGSVVEKEIPIFQILSHTPDAEIAVVFKTRKEKEKTKKREERDEKETETKQEKKRKTVDDLVSEMKEWYKCYAVERIEGEANARNREYVKIDLKDREEEVEMEEVFDKGKRVVIEGGAGMGKTSVLREMTRKWSEGELWNDRFDVLIYVRMEDIEVNNRTTMKSMLMDVLKDERMDACVSDFIGMRNWDRVLWMFDGWESVQKKGVLKAIEKKEERRVRYAVIAGAESRGIDCDRVLRIEGFNEEQMNEYASKFFGDSKEEMSEILKRQRWMKKLCTIPLVLGAICGMKRSERRNASVVLERVVQMMSKKSLHGDARKALCKVAYESHVNNVLQIDHHLMASECGNDSQLIEMIKECGLIHRGWFVDESIVAYLAAEHVCHGLRTGVTDVMLSAWDSQKETSDLFMRCCVGIGGNAIRHVSEWAAKIDLSNQHLGPFEWINEDKTGKLRSFLRKSWTNWNLNFVQDMILTLEKGKLHVLSFLRWLFFFKGLSRLLIF